MAVSPRVVELIQIARSWDYLKVTDEEMNDWLKEIQSTHLLMEMNVAYPVAIVRARCEFDFAEHKVDYACNISFLPDELKHLAKMLRCNRELNPVFYGVLKEKMVEGETLEEEVAMLESSKIANNRNELPDKEQAILSWWSVIKPFKAAILVHHKGFTQPHALLEQIRTQFSTEIGNDRLQDDRVEIAKFLSNEFAKPVLDENPHEYRLSSLIATHLFKNGCDALIYPTVRGNGIMLNIAMRKQLADPAHEDNVLKLIDLEMMWIQKRCGQTLAIKYKHTGDNDLTNKFDFQVVEDFEKDLAELEKELRQFHC